MDQNVKVKLVAALRSDKYRQGRNWLRQKSLDGADDCFCCLGVLCDVIDPKGWDLTVRSHRGMFNTPPDWLRESVGLTITDVTHLIKMNDQGLRSFEDIATYIEENM